MSSPFLQISEIYQKLKDIDLDKIASLSSRVDLKDLLDRISKMDDEQIQQVIEFINNIPVK
jgi:hypothetical protein